MLKKIYLEITNVCNLSCSFCHKTKRPHKLLTEEEFEILTDKLQGKAPHLYFHLMGEPTLHPLLPNFIETAKNKGFKPMLTTNGSLLGVKGGLLFENLPHKVNISLHAPDANPAFADESYLDNCLNFAKEAPQKGCVVALRLWNLGTSADNTHILDKLHEIFPDEWETVRSNNGYKLSPRLFLEYGEHFDWPDPSAPEDDKNADAFCFALRDQIGVLSDGTVVPCCLDADGNLALGNLFENDLDDILSSERAKNIYDGFTRRRACEELCRKCGYAKRFKRTNNEKS